MPYTEMRSVGEKLEGQSNEWNLCRRCCGISKWISLMALDSGREPRRELDPNWILDL